MNIFYINIDIYKNKQSFIYFSVNFLNMNRYLLLSLHVISLVLLGFGWFLNMLHIQISAQLLVSITLLDEKRSVLGTLQTLFESGNYFPFTLIALFGIAVPLVKSALLFVLILSKKPQPKANYFVKNISKWAMADVFVISIFVAFLTANTMQSTQANVEPGFYFFAGYVVLSGLVAMRVQKMLNSSASLTQ
jgi:paraquat-inducible protein A